MKLLSKRRLRTILGTAIAGSILFSSLPSYADNVSDMENISAGLESELASIDSELFSINESLNETLNQITITDSELQRTEDMLKQSQLDEEKQYKAMKARIKYMYESGNSSLLELIFSAKSLSDFVNRADFVSSVSDYDRKMLIELKNVREDIITQKDDIKAQKASLDALKDELSNTEKSLQARAATISFDLADYRAKIASVREEERRKQEEAVKKEQEEDKKEQENSSNQNAHPAPETQVPPNGGTVDNSSPPVGNVEADELELFAAILQCEAHNDYNSLLAVATVIMNRVESPRFPNTLHDVIYAPGQFEPTWSGRLDRVLSQGANPLPRQVAKDALNGARLAEVSDCYYFLYAGATNRPGVNIGGNVFFPSW